MPTPTTIVRFVRLARRSKDLVEGAPVLIQRGNVVYEFPPGMDEEVAKRIIWDKVLRPQYAKSEHRITLEGDKVIEDVSPEEMDKPFQFQVPGSQPVLEESPIPLKRFEIRADKDSQGRTVFNVMENTKVGVTKLGSFLTQKAAQDFLDRVPKSP